MNKKNMFMKLLNYMHDNVEAIYTFYNADGSQLLVKYDTDYYGDNDLDDDDPNYEDLWFLVLNIVGTENLFEISYHSMPKHVYCGSEKIY